MVVYRATLNETTQIGLEATPGTLVPADKLMTAMSIVVGPEIEIKEFAPHGQKFNAITVLNKQWSSADVEGVLTYSEIIYALSSIMGQTTPTGGPAYTWVFGMLNTAPDDPATYTIESGNSVAGFADRILHGMFTDLSIDINRGESSISGGMIGQLMTPGITMTASPTSVELKPVLPAHWDVYIDDTPGALGTTQMDAVFEANFSIGERFAPRWPLKSSATSWHGFVETRPGVKMELKMEADAEAAAVLTALQQGDRKYIRLRATSGTDYITGTTPYSLNIDMAAAVLEAPKREDMDGVWTAPYTFTAVYESTWGAGKAVEVTVVNAQATL